MSEPKDFPADVYESAIATAVEGKDLSAAVALMRRMAIAHPHRAAKLLMRIEGLLDALYSKQIEEASE